MRVATDIIPSGKLPTSTQIAGRDDHTGYFGNVENAEKILVACLLHKCIEEDPCQKKSVCGLLDRFQIFIVLNLSGQPFDHILKYYVEVAGELRLQLHSSVARKPRSYAFQVCFSLETNRFN